MLVQLFAIAFAVAFAYANKVPCEKFRWVGTSIKEDRQFHRGSLIVKVVASLIISRFAVLPFILCGLWIWVCFDIALNVFIGNTWFYTGDVAKTDRLLKKYAGHYAGLVKLLVCLSAILVINFFL